MAKKRKTKVQFTKILIVFILVNVVIQTYLCIFFGAETMGVALITEGIATFACYACKSFFETKSEKETELKSKFLQQNIELSEEQRGEP